jgi:DNA polymerase-1
MYGQRSGAAGRALGDLERAYPVAMAYLDHAYRNGVAGRSVRTFGGRLFRAALPPALTDSGPVAEPTDPVVPESPGASGGRGRYLRNAVIQGAAAELFKAWAATVRHVIAGLDGRIVLCLHDELLVHVPDQHADACAALVEQALTDSSRRWAQSDRVRFVADTSVIHRWSEAKA